MLQAWKIISLENPEPTCFKQGIALAHDEDNALTLCNDPSAIAIKLDIDSIPDGAERFMWTMPPQNNRAL